MNRIAIYLLVAMFSLSPLFAKYSKIIISHDEFRKISDPISIGFEKNDILPNGDNFELIADQYSINLLKSNGIKFSISIDDFESFLEKRNKSSELPKAQSELFSYGSMGGFYTLSELLAEYDSLVAKYPSYFQKEVIGTSIEGRDIVAYHITNFLVASPIKHPEILYTSLHHAREPQGATTLLYFIKHLMNGLDNKNPEAEYLVNNRYISVIPALNPDGYEYNHSYKPNGGGLWRKNRRKVNDSTYGVDLNRNYGPEMFWANSAGGSSTNPSISTYRGEAPFSEPETQAIKALCERSKFKVAINYHTFGGLLIYPWGVLSQETPDSSVFRKMCYYINSINKYVYGLDYQTLNYVSQGNADDWMYLETEEKNKILAITAEVGNENDYFWPPLERIEPLALENLRANYEYLWSASYNLKVINFNDDYDDQKDINTLKIEIANIGADLSPKTSFFNIKSLDDKIIIDKTEHFITSLKSGESQLFDITYTHKNGFENGIYVGFGTEVIQNGVSRKDTFFIRVIKPKIIELFSGETSDWDLGYWSLVDDKNINRKVLTDSPDSLYGKNINNYLTYNKVVNLEDYKYAILEFESKWFIEKDWDAGVVEIKLVGDDVWEPLASERMTLGLGINKSRQIEGKPVLQGNVFDYCRQSIDVPCGQQINLRFGLLSDNATAYDGWTISGIRFKFYDPSTKVDDSFTDKSNNKCLIFNKYKGIELSNNQHIAGKKYYLVNSIGKLVLSGFTEGGRLSLNTSSLPIGYYHLLFDCDSNTNYRIMLEE